MPFQIPGQSRNESFAGIMGSHFFVTPDKNRFSFLPSAGLMLTNTQLQDSGDYIVKINSHNGSGLVETDERRVTLIVAGILLVGLFPTNVLLFDLVLLFNFVQLSVFCVICNNKLLTCLPYTE